jgi:hypothetical protein
MNQLNLMPLGMGQLPTQAVMGFVGNPRIYKFQASQGLFMLEDLRHVTEQKDQFTVIPLSFRLFHAEMLFQRENARWVEICFLNGQGNICILSFHEHSVRNFLEAHKNLTLDGLDACDAQWTLTPEDKLKKISETKQNKYFLLNFKYKMLDEKTKVFHDTIRAEHRLFREYTMTVGGVTNLASKHWYGLKDRSITTDLLEPKRLASIAEIKTIN